MNFLAHLYLSDNDDDLLIGNFIADSVRSSEWGSYQPQVVKGIKLHHKIDSFTDSHATVERSKERIRQSQGKYSPVVVDIFYDHFLSHNFSQYSNVKVEDFARQCYGLFRRRFDELPLRVQNMLPYMIRGNWLVNYGNRQGMERVFNGMSNRASFANGMQKATEELFLYYEEFQRDFEEYFPELQDYVKGEVDKISD